MHLASGYFGSEYSNSAASLSHFDQIFETWINKVMKLNPLPEHIATFKKIDELWTFVYKNKQGKKRFSAVYYDDYDTYESERNTLGMSIKLGNNFYPFKYDFPYFKTNIRRHGYDNWDKIDNSIRMTRENMPNIWNFLTQRLDRVKIDMFFNKRYRRFEMKTFSLDDYSLPHITISFEDEDEEKTNKLPENQVRYLERRFKSDRGSGSDGDFYESDMVNKIFNFLKNKSLYAGDDTFQNLNDVFLNIFSRAFRQGERDKISTLLSSLNTEFLDKNHVRYIKPFEIKNADDLLTTFSQNKGRLLLKDVANSYPFYENLFRQLEKRGFLFTIDDLFVIIKIKY